MFANPFELLLIFVEASLHTNWRHSCRRITHSCISHQGYPVKDSYCRLKSQRVLRWTASLSQMGKDGTVRVGMTMKMMIVETRAMLRFPPIHMPWSLTVRELFHMVLHMKSTLDDTLGLQCSYPPSPDNFTTLCGPWQSGYNRSRWRDDGVKCDAYNDPVCVCAVEGILFLCGLCACCGLYYIVQ